MQKTSPHPDLSSGPEVLRPLGECARAHRISRSTLHSLLTSGAIAYVRLPGGERRITDAAVREWIAANAVHAKRSAA